MRASGLAILAAAVVWVALYVFLPDRYLYASGKRPERDAGHPPLYLKDDGYIAVEFDGCEPCCTVQWEDGRREKDCASPTCRMMIEIERRNHLAWLDAGQISGLIRCGDGGFW